MKTHAFGFCIAVMYGTACLASGDSGSPIDGDADYERVKRILYGYSMWNYFHSEDHLPDKQEADSLGPESFPSLIRFLLDEERRYSDFVILRVLQSDGQIPTSAGDRGMLNAMSEYVKQTADNTWFRRTELPMTYIIQKGGANDLDILQYVAQKFYDFEYDVPATHKIESDAMRLLQARVDGVNLLGGVAGVDLQGEPDKGWLLPVSSSDGAGSALTMQQISADYGRMLSTNEPPFVPSVANTGPQAAYVYDLLKQALTKYGAPTNIPPELVKMVVSFDADGKPVCNVDLSKYGLAMPDFMPSPSSSRPVPPPSPVTDTNTAVEPPPQQNAQPPPAAAPATETDATDAAEPATAPSPRSWLATLFALGVGMAIALVLLMTLWKKRRQ